MLWEYISNFIFRPEYQQPSDREADISPDRPQGANRFEKSRGTQPPEPLAFIIGWEKVAIALDFKFVGSV